MRAPGEPSPFTPNVDRACETKQLFFAAAGEMNDLGIHLFFSVFSRRTRRVGRGKEGNKKNGSSVKGEETRDLVK